MKEKIFIKNNIEHNQVEEFLRDLFKDAKLGEIEFQHTPVGTRIIIHTVTPGLVIGSSGSKVKEASKKVQEKTGIENPQIDVQKIENPDLDPIIVAQNISSALEKGINYKRLGNQYVNRIMQAGAEGCEIVLAGKFSGQRGRRERFVKGHIKKSGNTAKTDVKKGYSVANPPLGNVGVHVLIMEDAPKKVLDTKFLEEKTEDVKEDKESEESKEEKKDES